jgi:hypothetical protein
VSAVLATNDAADEVVSNEPFYAPAPTDLVEELLAQYQLQRARIDQLAALVAGDLGNVVHYFIEGNAGDDRFQRSLYVDRLFQTDGAIAALNSAMWSKAMALTDVYNYMPQKRRTEWDTMLREQKAPEFTAEAVRPTLLELLNSRERFFAERVDGIFRGLSGRHVTNAPEAFGKRMIVAGVLTSYGTTESRVVGLINDLRCVVAKFSGREEPRWNSSDVIVRAAHGQRGEWLSIDGGAMRIRVYNVGTAHLEVHPDMAWRLNAVLAHMHPTAIPAQFRQKPRRKSKEWAPMMRPLPARVLEVLEDVRIATEKIPGDWRERRREVPNTLAMFGGSSTDKAVMAEARRVMQAIGGVPSERGHHWQFAMPAHAALSIVQSIVASGMMPDKVSHQFYPTPESLARRVSDLAEVGPAHTVLEPSAGQGALIEQLPPEQKVTAVEVSELHCEILRARFTFGGVEVVQADFVDKAWAWMSEGRRFDRVLMNPPFEGGRARDHIVAAADVVAAGGRLVAILPSGMRGSEPLGAAFEHAWHGPFDNEFAGTSVSVCILVANRVVT